MDWTHTLTIIGALGGFIIYTTSRFDRRIDTLETKIESTSKSLNDKIESSNKSLNDKIESSKKELKLEIRDLDKKIEGLQKDINQINSNVSNIEGQITQMTRPKFIPIDRLPDQDIKEN